MQAYTEGSGDSLASQGSSHKKDLEFFQKFGFLDFSQLSLATCLRVEGSVARGLRDFRSSPRNSLTRRTSSREKHLDKFFKIFVLSVLATGLGDLLTT